MNVHVDWHLLWQQIAETDWLQWVAVSLGVAEVLFAKANKIWLYPTGLVGTLLSIYILFLAGLFAECLLNGYYVVMSIYGWWYWVKKQHLPPVKITRCSRREWITVAGITLVSFSILTMLLRYYTSSTVPVWDAWVSATAWAGMWLLAKRKIENWILLNISNAFAIPLLLYKQLPLYAGLTLFLFIVAVAGYFQWRKILRHSGPGSPADRRSPPDPGNHGTPGTLPNSGSPGSSTNPGSPGSSPDHRSPGSSSNPGSPHETIATFNPIQ